ncbi:MAG: c-type cytochrome biogenesis protein CcsB [Desulfobacterales bacterium]
MDILIHTAVFIYLLSTAGYVAYLFVQKYYLQKTGFYLLLAGFLCHTIAIGFGFFQIGHIPISNFYETLIVAGWAVAAAFIIFQFKFNLKILGVYAAPLVLLITGAAVLLPKESVETQAIFKNVWFVFHILAVFVGEATFALACGVGVLYLIQERSIKSKSPGFFYKRLPSLELLDSTGYACIVTGFTLLTAGIVTGMVYAKSVWGSFWSWDPKEVWSAISWLLYAALLHQRVTIGLRGRRAAIMAIVGFGVLLFTFFGVNFLLEGHHEAFTRK